MKPSSNYTPHYALIQSSYWLTNMPILAFGPMYLYSLGLSNTAVGFFFAAANLLSILLQPMTGSLIDKETLTLRQAVFSHAGLLFLLIGILYLPITSMKIGAHFLTLVLVICLQPMVNTLSIDALHSGITLDFGVARGTASLVYGISSLILGKLIGIFDTSIIPLMAFLSLSTFTFAFYLFPKTITSAENDNNSSSLSGLNRPFFLMLLATFFLFINHCILNNFLLRIVENVGGGSTQFGIALGIAAAAELPIMASFTKLRNRFGTVALLRLSSMFFLVKSILLIFANTPALLYVNQLLQMLTFGLYFPAAVAYVQETLPFSLRARSQALLISTITLGCVIASLLGGAVLDALHVEALLVISAIFSTLGFISILFLKEKKSPKAL